MRLRSIAASGGLAGLVTAVAANSPLNYSYNSTLTEIPGYVIEHAPALYLYSEEIYLPGGVGDYVQHFAMATRYENKTGRLTIDQLVSSAREIEKQESTGAGSAIGSGTVHAADASDLTGGNGYGVDLCLNAQDAWEGDKPWVVGKGNVPNLSTGKILHAPATLIAVDKGEYLDAFWFYFYPFNQGPFVMGGGPYGNHLGDWEHSLVRFDKASGRPVLVWMSAHGGGTAYHWGALETLDNNDKRPLLFAARGTHAHYVSVGQHSHDIPWHMLSDFTDRGPLWDPSQNYLAYTFNGTAVHPANGSDEGRELAYGDWLLYSGLWGDFKLAPNDPRQKWSPFEYRMIDGPRGPLFKNLMRAQPCQRYKWWNFLKVCRVRNRITPGEGIEADASGCAAIVERFPTFLQWPVRHLTQGGWLCFWLDRLWG